MKKEQITPADPFKNVQLQSWVIEKLLSKEHRRTRLALMALHEKAETTIGKWIHSNHRLLSKHYSLELLSAYMRAEPEMLIEPRPAPEIEN